MVENISEKTSQNFEDVAKIDISQGQFPIEIVQKYWLQARFINKSLFIFLTDWKTYISKQFSPISQNLLDEIQDFYVSSWWKYDIQNLLKNYIWKPWRRDAKWYMIE